MLKWCKQCKRDRPETEFLRVPKSERGWRVTKCNECAVENMRRWAATSLSQFDPNKVIDAGD